MARTKKTSRQNVGGKAPRKQLGELKKAIAGTTGGVKAKRQWLPGTVSLREIKRYQTRHGDDTRLMIPKAAFGRLVREVTQDLNLAGFTHVQPGHVRYKPTAVSALQHAAEGYLTEILAESQDLAIHSQREGIDKRDILFANWKATTTPQSRSLANCNVPWKRPRKSKTPRRRKPRRVPVVEAPAAARKVPKKKTKAAPAEPESEPDDEGSNTPAEDADDDDAASYADEEQVEEEA